MQLAVLGAGAWGLALSNILSVKNEVALWSRAEVPAGNACARVLAEKFSSCADSAVNIKITHDIAQTLRGKMFFFAVPAQAVAQVGSELSSFGIALDAIIVVCAKGIDVSSGLFPYQVLENIFPRNPVVVLSGPNFAGEIMERKPAAADIAACDIVIAKRVADIMKNNFFNAAVSDDRISVQLAGAMKNVIAIGCGLALGWDMGENARSLVFRGGFSEMTTLCQALGGKASSMLGLSGIGDLFLTCASLTSRNTRLGWNIARGQDDCGGVLSEGMYSAEALVNLAGSRKIELPLCHFISQVMRKAPLFGRTQYASLLLSGCNAHV